MTSDQSAANLTQVDRVIRMLLRAGTVDKHVQALQLMSPN